MSHQVMYYLGLTSPNGWPYLMWSGIASDMAKVAIVGSLIRSWRLHHHHMREHHGDAE